MHRNLSSDARPATDRGLRAISRGREPDGRLVIPIHRVAPLHSTDRARAVDRRDRGPRVDRHPLLGDPDHPVLPHPRDRRVVRLDPDDQRADVQRRGQQLDGRHRQPLHPGPVVVPGGADPVGAGHDYRRAGARADQPLLLDQDGAGRVRHPGRDLAQRRCLRPAPNARIVSRRSFRAGSPGMQFATKSDEKSAHQTIVKASLGT